MGFFKTLQDAFSMGPTQDDVDAVMDRRERESGERSKRLAQTHTSAELARQLAAERARMPELLDTGNSREIDDCSRLVGDLMNAAELQRTWGI